MKKPSIIINIIFAFAIAILFILQSQNKSTSHTKSEKMQSEITDDTTSQSTFPVAYIIVDSVMQNYEYYSLLEENFQRDYKREEQVIQRKAAAFEKEVGEFQQKVQNGLITTKNAETKQMKLQQKQQQLMEMQQNKSNALAQKEQTLMKELLDSVRANIKVYNKDKKFEIVLNNAFESNILYATEKLNITKDILSLMNVRYVESQK
ncbi:MAG: OmpH family outer membrane protein [Bacteroidales bacterium]|jgi:outer membrane protein|nr:OmpH family outer membrane protein [Bacteroidales bacterium]